MAHGDNNLLDIPLSEIVSEGKHEAFRRNIGVAMTVKVIYFFNQGGVHFAI